MNQEGNEKLTQTGQGDDGAVSRFRMVLTKGGIYRLPKVTAGRYDKESAFDNLSGALLRFPATARCPFMMKGAPGKITSPTGAGAGARSRARKWHASNCALARLLNGHRRELQHAVAMAADIRRGIDRLASSMTALCRRTCRFCPEPCCITNTVWIDFRDLLYLHLLDEPIPPCQAASDPGEACPFLSHRGCLLPLRIRPWMCIRYLCPTQRAVLHSKGRPATAVLLDQIERIDNNRLRLETEVIRCIRRWRQPSPSSSPACSRQRPCGRDQP
ncbi:hypothetical protein [Desulfosarcina alkanivorans]|uniref:hypothetical protein n=1 Tax=Desulfosarcina alkanivorans TaxID=571177 RepID=UPI0012D3015F|nr:hypothetical protein [Desulfosarcina alkanivorans]